MKTTKNLVKAARKKLNISAEEATRQIGLRSLSFVTMVETGRRLFDLGRLPAVANALDIPLESLVYAYLRESKTVPSSARAALIKTMLPQKPEWQVKLEELNPAHFRAVMEAISVLHAAGTAQETDSYAATA